MAAPEGVSRRDPRGGTPGAASPRHPTRDALLAHRPPALGSLWLNASPYLWLRAAALCPRGCRQQLHVKASEHLAVTCCSGGLEIAFQASHQSRELLSAVPSKGIADLSSEHTPGVPGSRQEQILSGHHKNVSQWETPHI